MSINLLWELQDFKAVWVGSVSSLSFRVVIHYSLVRKHLLDVAVEERHDDGLTVCRHLLPCSICEENLASSVAVDALNLITTQRPIIVYKYR